MKALEIWDTNIFCNQKEGSIEKLFKVKNFNKYLILFGILLNLKQPSTKYSLNTIAWFQGLILDLVWLMCYNSSM